MYKILIVEDNKKLANELSVLLTRSGYVCDSIVDFENVCDYVINYNPDLLLLDINLPVYDGYYILREIRSKSNMPIIIVTSRNSDMDELMGMNLGADDFITKPYNHNILLARVSRIIDRIYDNNSRSVFSHKNLQLDLSLNQITFETNKIELTKNETRILEKLIQSPNHVVSRDDLMEFLWESNEFIDDNTLTVNINRLRKKIMDIGINEYIVTKRGKGYTLI